MQASSGAARNQKVRVLSSSNERSLIFTRAPFSTFSPFRSHPRSPSAHAQSLPVEPLSTDHLHCHLAGVSGQNAGFSPPAGTFCTTFCSAKCYSNWFLCVLRNEACNTEWSENIRVPQIPFERISFTTSTGRSIRTLSQAKC